MKNISLIALIAALLIFAVPAFAQETPTLPEIPVMPLPDALALLLAAISSVLVGLVASPVTLGLVALLKRFAPLDGVPANILQLIVAGIIAVLFWAAGFLGLDEQFRTVYGFLLSVLPALAGMFANQVAAAVEYRAAKAYDVGFFGYQRTSEDEDTINSSNWLRETVETAIDRKLMDAFAPGGYMTRAMQDAFVQAQAQRDYTRPQQG